MSTKDGEYHQCALPVHSGFPWRYAPQINIEPENDGLEDDLPFQWSILRFHVNLPGCRRRSLEVKTHHPWCFFSQQKNPGLNGMPPKCKEHISLGFVSLKKLSTKTVWQRLQRKFMSQSATIRTTLVILGPIQLPQIMNKSWQEFEDVLFKHPTIPHKDLFVILMILIHFFDTHTKLKTQLLNLSTTQLLEDLSIRHIETCLLGCPWKFVNG